MKAKYDNLISNLRKIITESEQGVLDWDNAAETMEDVPFATANTNKIAECSREPLHRRTGKHSPQPGLNVCPLCLGRFQGSTCECRQQIVVLVGGQGGENVASQSKRSLLVPDVPDGLVGECSNQYLVPYRSQQQQQQQLTKDGNKPNEIKFLTKLSSADEVVVVVSDRPSSCNVDIGNECLNKDDEAVTLDLVDSQQHVIFSFSSQHLPDTKNVPALSESSHLFGTPAKDSKTNEEAPTPPAAPRKRPLAHDLDRTPDHKQYSCKGQVAGPPLARHSCPYCQKTFRSNGKLNNHVFSHTGERPFVCHHCHKAFSSKFKLVRHLLIHSKDRKFLCTVCERRFLRNDHLKNHYKVHAPRKTRYRCLRSTCEKEYSSALSQRKHEAWHRAQDGDTTCLLCNMKHETSSELLIHLRGHSSGNKTASSSNDTDLLLRKFCCHVCGRDFLTRKDVTRHLVVHTGERDFLCQFCPQRFGRKDHLVRHINKAHTAPGSNNKKKKLKTKGKTAAATGVTFEEKIRKQSKTCSDEDDEEEATDEDEVGEEVEKETGSKGEEPKVGGIGGDLFEGAEQNLMFSEPSFVDDEEQDLLMPPPPPPLTQPQPIAVPDQLSQQQEQSSTSTGALLRSLLLSSGGGGGGSGSSSHEADVPPLPGFSQVFHSCPPNSSSSSTSSS